MTPTSAATLFNSNTTAYSLSNTYGLARAANIHNPAGNRRWSRDSKMPSGIRIQLEFL
jgi:hypothetical protein